MDYVNEISDQEEVKVFTDKINDLRIEYENLYQIEMNKLTILNLNSLNLKTILKTKKLK